MPLAHAGLAWRSRRGQPPAPVSTVALCAHGCPLCPPSGCAVFARSAQYLGRCRTAQGGSVLGSMRLDSVEIVGFKSFCDRQEVSFKGGVTGIVGPNGCGKSNISDAINWVLGEQSAKSLRGTSMEDVIFNGSSSRQPLQMAEVNLKVSGLNGNSPDGSPECVVTRRLYRNGESEYLMNGRICRLRDIHELFMDTGLGSKAYSIIEQGKIGQILSSQARRSPRDHRGGGGHHEVQGPAAADPAQARGGAAEPPPRQRHRQRGREAAREPQAPGGEGAALARGHARRCRGVERVLFGRRFLDLRERSRVLEERHGAEAERERAASIALETEEAQLEAPAPVALRARGAPRGGARAPQRAHPRRGPPPGPQRLLQAAARRERGPGRSRRRATSRSSSPAWRRSPRRSPTGARRSRGSHDELAHGGGRARRGGGRGGGGRRAAGGGRGRAGARARVPGGAARPDRHAAELARVGGRQRRARGGRPAEARRRDRGARARARPGWAPPARPPTPAGARPRPSWPSSPGPATPPTARADEARGRAESLGREADALQSERDGLAGRRASLEEMVATHSAFDEGVRALLGRPEGLEVFGVVADALETGSEHERAVEAFLGDRLQAVLVPDAEQARRGIRWLQASSAGPRRLPAPRLGAHPQRLRPAARDRARRSRRPSGCCPTSTAWAARTRTASAPRSPTRSWWRPSRTRSRWPRGRARSRW